MPVWETWANVVSPMPSSHLLKLPQQGRWSDGARQAVVSALSLCISEVGGARLLSGFDVLPLWRLKRYL